MPSSLAKDLISAGKGNVINRVGSDNKFGSKNQNQIIAESKFLVKPENYDLSSTKYSKTSGLDFITPETRLAFIKFK